MTDHCVHCGVELDPGTAKVFTCCDECWDKKHPPSRPARDGETLSDAKRATESFSDHALIAEGARRFAAGDERPMGGQGVRDFSDTVLLGMLASRIAALRSALDASHAELTKVEAERFRLRAEVAGLRAEHVRAAIRDASKPRGGFMVIDGHEVYYRAVLEAFGLDAARSASGEDASRDPNTGQTP